MDFLEPSLASPSVPVLSAERAALRARLRDAAVVLQAEGAVTGVQGLAWLAERRDAGARARLTAIQVEAMAEGWTPAELVRARLACLRPRRSEIAELRAAYLDALAPDAVSAAHRLRTAGYTLELSGDVATEALLGVADALGVTADAIHAPRVRFDALGSYTGCEAAPRPRAGAAPRLVVGTRVSELAMERQGDLFVRYTGFVAHEGPVRGESVSTFTELAALLA